MSTTPEALQLTPELSNFFLAFIRDCLWAATIVAVLGIVCVLKASKEAILVAVHLVTQGDALRMVTVAFIIAATTGLVVLGPIDGHSAVTIFSGIAGYVLGSGVKKPKQNDKEISKTVTTGPKP
jgi:hypothetical protein